jgi:hypothetical protein
MPPTSTEIGPHEIQYDSFGVKLVSLDIIMTSGCVIKGSTNITLQNSTMTSIHETLPVINNLQLYPNPTKNNAFQLQFSAQKQETVRLELWNNLGQSILYKVLDAKRGENIFNIALPSYLKGTFVVKIIDSKSYVLKKLVKT